MCTTAIIFILVFATSTLVECGKFQIVGGKPTEISEFPFLGVFLSNNVFVCSCSLVSSTFAVTAAHCTYYFPYNITLRFGSTYRDRDGMVVKVTRFYQNPNFDIRSYDYDISLLKLFRAIRLTSAVYPVKLPAESVALKTRTSVRVAGWGLRSYDDDEDPPLQLLSTSVQISNFANCSRNYLLVAQTLTDRMMCASAPNRDACLGDSGGPLVFNDTLYGIVSFGYGCSERDYPGVYTNVSNVLPWVKRIFQLLA